MAASTTIAPVSEAINTKGFGGTLAKRIRLVCDMSVVARNSNGSCHMREKRMMVTRNTTTGRTASLRSTYGIKSRPLSLPAQHNMTPAHRPTSSIALVLYRFGVP